MGSIEFADEILSSFEVDLIAKKKPDRTEWLNMIGQDSRFHETHGYYATQSMKRQRRCPKAGKAGLVNLHRDTAGVTGLCLDPHDLAIAKYVARREKDILFNRELATRGIVKREQLLLLLDATPLDEVVRGPDSRSHRTRF